MPQDRRARTVALEEKPVVCGDTGAQANQRLHCIKDEVAITRQHGFAHCGRGSGRAWRRRATSGGRARIRTGRENREELKEHKELFVFSRKLGGEGGQLCSRELRVR